MSKAFYKAKQAGHLPKEIYCGEIPRHMLTLKVYRRWKRALAEYDRKTRKWVKVFRAEMMQDVTCWPPADCRHPRFRERW
ncbi:MAG: hypothetical protein VB088_08055 [Sphaerochaeta sp.]|nr:hypothetical protein [Sphaerochaeta sp.]